MKEPVSLPPLPTLEFDGYSWGAKIKLDTWKGYRASPECGNESAMAKTSDGSAFLDITPPDDQDAPPSEEQIAAYKYLAENEKAVHQSLMQAVLDDYPYTREAYGYDEETCMPDIEQVEQFRFLIGLGGVAILRAVKDGVAYIRFDFRAAWDPEHGFSVLMHKSRAVRMGHPSDGEFGAEEDALNHIS